MHLGIKAVHACINAKYFNLCKQARVAFFLWSMHDSANSASWEIDSKVWATLWSSRELQYVGEGWGRNSTWPKYNIFFGFYLMHIYEINVILPNISIVSLNIL